MRYTRIQGGLQGCVLGFVRPDGRHSKHIMHLHAMDCSTEPPLENVSGMQIQLLEIQTSVGDGRLPVLLDESGGLQGSHIFWILGLIEQDLDPSDVVPKEAGLITPLQPSPALECHRAGDFGGRSYAGGQQYARTRSTQGN